jgi:hypothetical protein
VNSVDAIAEREPSAWHGLIAEERCKDEVRTSQAVRWTGSIAIAIFGLALSSDGLAWLVALATVAWLVTTMVLLHVHEPRRRLRAAVARQCFDAAVLFAISDPRLDPVLAGYHDTTLVTQTGDDRADVLDRPWIKRAMRGRRAALADQTASWYPRLAQDDWYSIAARIAVSTRWDDELRTWWTRLLGAILIVGIFGSVVSASVANQSLKDYLALVLLPIVPILASATDLFARNLVFQKKRSRIPRYLELLLLEGGHFDRTSGLVVQRGLFDIRRDAPVLPSRVVWWTHERKRRSADRYAEALMDQHDKLSRTD